MADIVKELDKQIYKTTLGEDEVIIGDETSLDIVNLIPKIKFTKWKREESLSITIPCNLITDKKVKIKDEKTIEIEDSDTGFYFNSFDEHNFKCGVILYKKPDDKYLVTIDGEEYYQWSYQLESWEGFNFYYQPSLEKQWEQNNMGMTLPEFLSCHSQAEGVAGSYAVYHKYKKNHRVGKTNYKTGKAFHIYIPKFINVDNEFIYGKLLYEKGVLKELCPKEFIDKGKFPIKSNATFGSPDADTSTSTWGPGKMCSKATPTDGDGTAVSFHWYWRYGRTDDFNGMIYRNSDQVLIANSGFITADNSDSSWQIFSLSGESLVNNIVYMIGLEGGDGTQNISMQYDTGDAGDSFYEATVDDPSENPWVDYSIGNRLLRCYITYTPSGAPAAATGILNTRSGYWGDL